MLESYSTETYIPSEISRIWDTTYDIKRTTISLLDKNPLQTGDVDIDENWQKILVENYLKSKIFPLAINACQEIIEQIQEKEKNRLQKLWTKENILFLANLSNDLIYWRKKIDEIREQEYKYLVFELKDFKSWIIYCEWLIKNFQSNDNLRFINNSDTTDSSHNNNENITECYDTQIWKIKLVEVISLYSQSLLNQWDEHKSREIYDYYMNIWGLWNY